MSYDPHTDESPSEPTPAETAAGRLLDERAQAEAFDALSREERRRVADWQWLHSLLAQVLHRDAVGRDRRITRACLAIRDDAARQAQPASSTRNRRPARWLIPATIAAALMVSALLFRNGEHGNPRTTALAAVQTTLREAQGSSDRLYQVAMQFQNLGGDLREQTGELWVHGGAKFVLKQRTQLGDVFLGSDGAEHWFVPSIGPVVLGSDAGVFEQVLIGRPVATPYMQVTSVLERMAERYELSLAAEEELPAVDGPGSVRCTHVVGRKRAVDAPLAPDVIELWTARQSGIAWRIVAKWTAADAAGPRELRLQYAPLKEPVATDWYGHATHHAADRRVIRRGNDASGDL